MAKSRNKRKNGKSKKSSIFKRLNPLSPEYYIQRAARKLSIHDCLIGDDWKESSFTILAIMRKKQNGSFACASYMIDLGCLGVKNASYWADLSPEGYSKWLHALKYESGLDMVAIEPNLAFNIVYSAVEYAKGLGFSPHSDFKTAKYFLDDKETIEPVDIPCGGKDGKPMFVSGSHDNTEKILATLRKNVGEGNFNFIVEL